MADKGYKSAAELMAELEDDPEFKARQAEIAKRQAERTGLAHAEDKHLCADLASVGVDVASVYDLVNTKTLLPASVPVLIEWLSKAQIPAIKEGIARALSSKAAGSAAARALIEEFQSDYCTKISNGSVKWAIGNAIGEAANPTMFDALKQLVVDPNHGSARQMIVVAIGGLGKNRRESALELLLSLLDDEIVQGHAITALRYLKDERCRLFVEPFLDHEKAWIRSEAKKVIAVLDRAM